MHLSGGPDRRLSGRFNVAVPFRYRGLNSKGPERMAEAINISERGLYFETDAASMVDTDLKLRLVMPEAVTGKLPEELDCIGHVVRCEPGIYNPDRIGVGVCLDSFETLKNTRDAGSRRTLHGSLDRTRSLEAKPR